MAKNSEAGSDKLEASLETSEGSRNLSSSLSTTRTPPQPEKFFPADALALRVVDLVNSVLAEARVGHWVEAVGLDVDLHLAEQRFERARVITTEKILALSELQSDRGLRTARNGRRFYEYSAGVYDGWGVPLSNLARVAGFDSVEKLVFREDGTPASCLELAAGNAYLSRGWLGVFEELDPLLRLRHQINDIQSGEEDKIFEYIKRELLGAQIPPHQKPQLYHHITAIDYAQPFVERWQHTGVQGVCADICAPPEQFLRQTKLTPHSFDRIFKLMALDRIPDLEACVRNIKLCARTDGSTDVVFGSIFPLSHRSDSDSKNPNIPALQFWDPLTDPRRFCMGPDKVQAIANFCLYLQSRGFKVEHIAVQPSYEAVNVHCIVETVAVIRRDYAHIKQHEFFDPELNLLRDRIFSGEMPDDQLICIPQEYRDLVLVHAKVKSSDL